MKWTARGVAAALLVLVIAAACVRLGVWQLDRLAERRARNAEIAAANAEPVVALDAAGFARAAADPAAFAWRRAEARGRFAPAGDVIVRGRAMGGKPGVHLLSPLVTEAGEVVFVLRGWVPAADAASARAAEFRTDSAVSVSGVLLPIRRDVDGGFPAPGREGADTTYRRLDLAVALARAPGPVLPLVLQRLPDGADAAPPVAVPLPPPGEGNHLSYAVQWFSFAAIALIGFAVVVIRRGRG